MGLGRSSSGLFSLICPPDQISVMLLCRGTQRLSRRSSQIWKRSREKVRKLFSKKSYTGRRCLNWRSRRRLCRSYSKSLRGHWPSRSSIVENIQWGELYFFYQPGLSCCLRIGESFISYIWYVASFRSQRRISTKLARLRPILQSSWPYERIVLHPSGVLQKKPPKFCFPQLMA